VDACAQVVDGQLLHKVTINIILECDEEAILFALRGKRLMRELMEEDLQEVFNDGAGHGVAARVSVLHLSVENAEEGAQRRHEVARMEEGRGRLGQEEVRGQSLQLQPLAAAVVEPESRRGICALVVEDALIVDEDIAALHVIHTAADADVPAPLAYKLKFQIVFMPMEGGGHEGVLAVVVADVDEAECVVECGWGRQFFCRIAVEDRHGTSPHFPLNNISIAQKICRMKDFCFCSLRSFVTFMIESLCLSATY
jgi:hypothetical protein